MHNQKYIFGNLNYVKIVELYDCVLLGTYLYRGVS